MADTRETCRTNIGNLLQRELELTTQLQPLLADEYRSIVERDTTCFEQLIADKAGLLERLSGLEQERATIQENAGFAAGHAGMEDCLCWCDPRQQLVPHWQALQAHAAVCHRLNRKNQQLAELCSRHVREALHLLRGEELRQDTYLADGETDHRHSSRSIARA